MTSILNCMGWRPGIGDPTWEGWVIVALYAGVAVLAFAARGRAGFPVASRLRERSFWLVVGLAMAALAINKQLDLQTALTDAGRCAAKAQGWYQGRRAAQAGFLLTIAALAVLFLGAMLRLLRGTLRRTGPAALGLAFVLGFVLMRAVGFHHFDRFIGMPILGLKANTLLEAAGPLLITLGALLATPRRTRGAGRRIAD